MFYASASTGYKGPGFNVNTSIIGDSQLVQPETSTSYDIGMKSQYMNRRVTLNLNAFYPVFEDFQTQGGFSVPNNPANRIILLNAEELKTQGFEAELTLLPLEMTEIRFNLSFIDATFERFTNAPCYSGQTTVAPGTCVNNVQNLSGTRLPNTPEWSCNLFLKQEFPVFSGRWRSFATLDYSWRDDVQWSLLGSPDGIEQGYGLLGASVGLRSEDDRIHLKAYGKNLTDKFHTSGIVADRQVTHFLPPDYRRIYGVEASYQF